MKMIIYIWVYHFYLFKGEGGGKSGVKVRFMLLWHLIKLLYLPRKPQKLDRQKYISMELSFYNIFKNTTFGHLRGIGKLRSISIW